MVYLETGFFPWKQNYGFGRYINELLLSRSYDYVICFKSMEMDVPIRKKAIGLNANNYMQELQGFICNTLQPGDIIHFPANSILPINIPQYIKVIYTLHDITPLLIYKKGKNGNYLSDGTPLSITIWRNNVEEALKRADIVITDSQASKTDIEKYFSDSLQGKKIQVIYLGVNPIFKKYCTNEIDELRKNENINNKTCFLAINGGKHKNIFRLLLAYYLLLAKMGATNYLFILVGHVSPKLLLLTLPLRKKGKVICVGKINDEELVTYYNIVDCFIFPSLYEGFGLPLLEAMRCGTQVICSNNSSLKELSNRYATLVNPKSILELERAMENITEFKQNERDEMIAYAKEFSWDTTRNNYSKLLTNI